MGVSDAHDVASATLYGDATAQLVLDGAMHAIRGSSDADARQQVLHLVAAKAREQNAAVLLATRDRFGSGHLRVRPGGVVEAVGSFMPAGPDDVLTPLDVQVDTTQALSNASDSAAEIAAVSDSGPHEDLTNAASEAAALEALYSAAATEPPVPHEIERPTGDDAAPDHGEPEPLPEPPSGVDARRAGPLAERPPERTIAVPVEQPVAPSISPPTVKPRAQPTVKSSARRSTRASTQADEVAGETRSAPASSAAAPGETADAAAPTDPSSASEVEAEAEAPGPDSSPSVPASARARAARSRSRRVSVPSVPDSAGPAESLWAFAPDLVVDPSQNPAGSVASVAPVAAVLPTPAPLPTPAKPMAPPERHEPGENEPAEEHADAVRTSFLAPERERRAATRGWRGALARTGLPVGPNRFERGERSDVDVVRRTWTGPRTIAVVNGKGGANKTPTTALLAAVFARLGGAGVLAWDNNDARGTLGWRTDSAGHELSAGEVLTQAQWLLSPDAGAADLAGHVHHQAVDRYDVLRASPLQLSGEHRIDEREFDALHAVASKYYRLVIIDSGNDESSPRWRRMIDRTDQLVVATTALGEHAEAGALLLEALNKRDDRSRALAERAVVVVSQSEKSAGTIAAKRIAEAFAPMVRSTVTVPYDRALHSGKIRFDTLEPDTRRAWLTAAAAAAEGL